MTAYQEEIKKCESANLTVNIRTLDNSAAVQQMQLAFSGGGTSPYDIVQMSNGSIATIGGQGWLLPLNDLVETYHDQYSLNDIPQAAWNAATFDGKILGIPVASNTLYMMYRKDLFEKYNITSPITYDEM
jgi:multiple sugar transport system substrate-binding protein